ncbi:hypothetical protein PGTUg99_009203 [Puccinia graminis f. sp. tritici]|uniref:Uncharacterized protein n=1 Tax=Puccinia graminis f. sp. tritici TaxID=56615 RepID=A0A5B0NE27_PUCGR|nr:hypothetical protein PGTUg99_009203 [Puccinia graminis f. sp. tritici]
MFEKRASAITRAYVIWIAIIYYVQVSEPRLSVTQCGTFIDALAGSKDRVGCETGEGTHHECDRVKCNSGLGPESDPRQHPFSSMVFQNCSPPNYSGPGKTVTNIVSMHVDYTTETIAIQADEPGHPRLSFYECSWRGNVFRPYCQDCTRID